MNLRKSLIAGLSVLGMLTVSVPAEAQTWFGFTAGYASTKFSRKGENQAAYSTDSFQYSSTSKGGLRLGVFADFRIMKKEWLRFTPEIAYTSYSINQKIDSTYDVFILTHPVYKNGHYRFSYNEDIKFTTIQIPLNIRASLQLNDPHPLYPNEGKGKPVFIDFILGPSINYAIGITSVGDSTYTRTSSIDDTSYTVTGKLDGDVKGIGKFTLGLNIGVGLRWKLAPKTILYCDVRYAPSLSNMNKGYWSVTNPNFGDPKKIEKSEPSIKANAVFFQIGFITHFSNRRYHYLID